MLYEVITIAWTAWPSGIPELAALAVVTVLHTWKKNAMLSIFGSTAFYMILKAVL